MFQFITLWPLGGKPFKKAKIIIHLGFNLVFDQWNKITP